MKNPLQRGVQAALRSGSRSGVAVSFTLSDRLGTFYGVPSADLANRDFDEANAYDSRTTTVLISAAVLGEPPLPDTLVMIESTGERWLVESHDHLGPTIQLSLRRERT